MLITDYGLRLATCKRVAAERGININLPGLILLRRRHRRGDALLLRQALYF